MPNRTSLVASTLMSSDTRSYSSSSSHPTHSTALTTPDLSSPKKNGGRLEAMLEVFEGGRQVEPTTTSSRRGSDVSRGPSVRMRASQFEQQAEASSFRLPAMPPVDRTRSTSPLRIAKTGTGMPLTPSRPRRIPVPSTAPPRAGQLYAEQPGPSPPRTRSPPRLHRGTTRRMVQQWESLPTTPASNRVVSTNITRDYLDKKPLPSPGANPSPRSTPGYRFPNSPSRNPYLTSPSQHLQTPRHTSHSLTNSPSSWSLSPSGEKRRKGKSPLKEMLNVFGGGILRKGKGKVKEKWNRGFDPSVPEGLDRMGSSGLPGGIVFRDRMGDYEMQQPRESDPSVIRSSAIIYLIPTPCSSVSPWGSWLTSWATLTPTCLSVTYCPIFQDPQAGNQTPKRVFSGSNPSKSADPPFTFAAIPLPSPNASADVELSMADCVEVRSLRKEEVKGRGVPPLPHGPGTEVLEMVWQDGTKRYMGVEGVSGRLGWVSAIWDVLLACKTNGMQALPPPSPTASPRQSVQLGAAPLRVPSGPYRADLGLPNQEFAPRERAQSGSTLKASRGNSSAPPVQKIGDRWIAAGAIANSDVGSARQVDAGTALRTSVQRMFEAGPDAMETEDEHMEILPAPDSSRLADRVNAWQPVSERELSIFSRNNSKRSAVPGKPTTFSEIDRVNGYPKSETTLSFDPNDLNPSRSASQVGRKNEPRNAPRNGLTVVDEASGVQMDAQTNFPAPTHISHVTFPKPTVGGVRILPAPPTQPSAQLNGGLETIPSAENSSVESSGETIRTPASTAASSLDHTILAKLQTQTTEHNTLSNQIDGVHVDLRQVILSLSSLVAKTRRTEDEAYISPALDDKLSTIHMDVKAIENALNLSTLSTAKLDEAGRAAGLADSNLADVHAKLDAIASLCENVLSKSSVETSSGAITTKDAKDQVDGAAKAGVPQGSLGIVLDSDEEKTAGNEVAQIMAELTGGSSKNSPRLGGLQVLHNISNPSSPRNSAPPSPVISGPPLSDDTKQQVGEVLGLVKELKEARTLQTQQTTDIARYLNELNSWLEKFVLNSTNEIASMSKRLTAIVGTDPDATPADGEKTIGMPDLVADMHSMITEQNRRIEAEGTATQRLDALLGMMGQERERQASQMGMVDQVMGVLDRQRSDNEVLLRALATDLTAEIRGERLRFVEAMQQATTMNISSHVEEFKKLLSAEVGKAMKELGQLREERKALEHQISDLFALKAKHGGRDSRKASAAVPAQAPPSPAPTMLSPQGGQMLLPPMQGYGGRILPSPPAR